MPAERLNIKDLRPEAISLEERRARNSEIISQAKKDIEEIAPSLRDLSRRIEKELPDIIFFLDKSARIFAAPFRAHLRARLGKNTPLIKRYNDDCLKNARTLHQPIDTIIAKDFQPLSGKKVFFVDETFFSGRGFQALKEACEKSGIKMTYFALSYDPFPEKSFNDPSKERHATKEERERFMKNLLSARSDPQTVIYPNQISILFSKKIVPLFVIEGENGKTQSRYTLPPSHEFRSTPPDSRKYKETPEEGWEAFDESVREGNMHTVRTISHWIYEALAHKE